MMPCSTMQLQAPLLLRPLNLADFYTPDAQLFFVMWLVSSMRFAF